MRFWVLGFQSFATYTNFKVLGLQGLAIAKILGSWVSRVSLHITILRSWVSRILRRITILMSWVSRVPRQKGSARSKIPQGPRPGTQRTLDLGSFWDLGTCLDTIRLDRMVNASIRPVPLSCAKRLHTFLVRPRQIPYEYHI